MRLSSMFGVFVVAASAAASAQAQPAATTVSGVETAPAAGVAAVQASVVARADALRRAWLAAGKPLPSASQAPVLLGGRILTPSIDVSRPPSAPAVAARYQTGAAGLNFAEFTFISAGRQQVFSVIYTAYASPPSTAGSFILQKPAGDIFDGRGALGHYAAAGQWNLAEVFLIDQAGNFADYTGAQLAGVFKTTSFTVVNRGFSDTVAPTINNGVIVTPTVSLSAAYPTFEATATVADSLSGVGRVALTIQSPGSSFGYGASANVSYPIRSGTVDIVESFTPADPTGTYTISGFDVCDVAGNCLYTQSAAAVMALFGTTTFNVTH